MKLLDLNLLIYAVDESSSRHQEARRWLDEAFDIIDGWLQQPSVTVIHPTDRHARLLRDLLSRLGTAGNLTSDAHLAALAIEHGAELCSTDADFGRFAGVRWVNPLSG